MQAEKRHVVPAGLTALVNSCAVPSTFAPILKVTPANARKRFRGLIPWTADDLVRIAEFLKLDPGDLFDPKLAERIIIPQDLMHGRMNEEKRAELVERQLHDRRLRRQGVVGAESKSPRAA